MSGNKQLNITTKSWDISASRVYTSVNANLTLEASGPTANLFIKTNGNTIITADFTSNVTFTNLPICSVNPPIILSQLVNKQYMDSLLGPYGAQGPQGAQGASGAQGSLGANGEQGTQGGQGSQGTQGVSGALGSQGTQGSQGAQGNIGTQGALGAVGIQGTQGLQGAQGFQGNSGFSGFSGNSGVSGGQGSTGAQGAQGAQGSPGDPGNTGFGGDSGGQGAELSMVAGDNFVVSQSSGVATISLKENLAYVGSSAYAMRTTTSTSSNIIFNSSFGGPTWNSSNFFYYDNTDFYSSVFLKFPLSNSGSGGTFVRGYINGEDHLHYKTSSLRYKTNIEVMQDNEELLKINPVFYNYKVVEENTYPQKCMGFIAEEMEKNELGNFFVIRNDDDSCETIDYSTLITLYASALRSIQTTITNMTSDIENLKEKQKIKYQIYEEKINALEIIKQN